MKLRSKVSGDGWNLRSSPGAIEVTGLTVTRRARRADSLVGDAEQALVATGAEEQPDDRDLPEHVVETVERHECSAQAHVILNVVDLPFDGRTHHRTAHHAIAHRHASGPPRELGMHLGKLHAAGYLAGRAGDHAI